MNECQSDRNDNPNIAPFNINWPWTGGCLPENTEIRAFKAWSCDQVEDMKCTFRYFPLYFLVICNFLCC